MPSEGGFSEFGSSLVCNGGLCCPGIKVWRICEQVVSGDISHSL